VSLIETRPLAIYLQDHLAGATAGAELAHRARDSNEDEGDLGDFLKTLSRQIDEDRGVLIEMMDHLGIDRSRVKISGAWVGERLGRLKLNGQLTGYSPLSRLIELEGLTVGVAGKRSLWQNLRSCCEAELARFDLDRLIARADKQLEGLTAFRQAAAKQALGE
jgi:hypothetical protein